MAQLFAPAVGRIRELLKAASRETTAPIDFAFIGGLAVAAWGVPRATQDIDLLANADPSPIGNIELRNRLKKFFEQQQCQVDWRVGDYEDPIPLLLRIDLPPSYDRLSADIVWAHKRWQREALQRKILVRVSRQRLPVLHPEDLILLKLDAGGPQDLLDVQKLLGTPPRQLNVHRLEETAARLRLGRLLEKCLRESRNKN